MENIRQALERSREPNVGYAEQKDYLQAHPPRPLLDADAAIAGRAASQKQDLVLNVAHLEPNRIIAHDDTDPRSKSFDMLRTQVLQAMDQKNWNVLGITSPSPGCGKTLTAINLACSIARRPERSVLLVDLDLQKPQDANYLGVDCECGVISVLEGRVSLANAIIPVRVGNCRMMILPAESTTSDSSARMSSRALSTMLQDLRRDYRSHIVILDLPPMLSSDDVIAVMPQLDCVLLVAAVGRSKVSEIEECNKHLRSTEVVRLVLNKVPNLNAEYYSYYGPRP
jgi:protein-tyrosine kinase